MPSSLPTPIGALFMSSENTHDFVFTLEGGKIVALEIQS
jgi:hypothetical protein